MTKPIPDGYTSVTPHLIVPDGAKAIEFYKKAFGAEERFRMPGPDGNGVMHAEIRIGDAHVMLGMEWKGMCQSPLTLGGTPVTLHMYVEDTDKAYQHAVAAGCESMIEPMDAFWGDRYCKVRDPFGHEWSIATHVADLTDAQMAEGMKAMMAGGCGD